jgi:hypothetical protein
MLKAIIAILVVLVAVAYVAGGWAERRNCAPVQARLAEAEARLVRADEQAHIAGIMADLMRLRDEVAQQNYGQARELSTPFFDDVRAAGARAHDAQVRQALDSLLAQRDPVTEALAQGDAAALALLQNAAAPLRNVLGGRMTVSVETVGSAQLHATPTPGASSTPTPSASATPTRTPPPAGTSTPAATPGAGATAVPSTTLPVTPPTLPSPAVTPPFIPPASTLAVPTSTVPPAPIEP